MFKAIVGIAVGSLLIFDAEALKTNQLSHEEMCLSDGGCYEMADCNWSAESDHNFLTTDKGKYYPNCNFWRQC